MCHQQRVLHNAKWKLTVVARWIALIINTNTINETTAHQALSFLSFQPVEYDAPTDAETEVFWFQLRMTFSGFQICDEPVRDARDQHCRLAHNAPNPDSVPAGGGPTACCSVSLGIAQGPATRRSLARLMEVWLHKGAAVSPYRTSCSKPEYSLS